MVLGKMLNTELDEELGYTKYDYKNKENTNSRNSHSKKKVHFAYEEIELAVLRSRKSEFGLIVVKKSQRNITSIEDATLCLYAKGMTIKDISEYVKEIYGREIFPEGISRVGIKSLTYDNMNLVYNQVISKEIRKPKVSAHELYKLLMKNLTHFLEGVTSKQ